MNTRQDMVRAWLPLALLLIVPVASADVIKVPQDFATIQEAVDETADGDTVLVAKGTYRENVVISTPSITLQGKGAVIDGQYLSACIGVNVVDGVAITGFTLINGSGGILLTGNDAVITKNVIENCSGTGIAIGGDDALIESNTVRYCDLGIQVSASATSTTTVGKNRLERNGFHASLNGGMWLMDKNRLSGGNGGLSVNASHASARSRITKNKIDGMDGNGLSVNNNGAGQVLIEKNKVDLVGENGISASGLEIELTGNTVARAEDTSILLSGDNFLLDGNKVLQGGGIGIAINGSGGRAEKNRVQGAFGDGMNLRGSDNVIDGNTLSNNGQDGIDLGNSSGLTQSVDNSLTDNVCLKNGHEGIDNSGIDTVIVGNRALGNARGIGPDIAGAGDDVNAAPGGDGTVAPPVTTFQADNKFKTGGQTIDSRLELDN